MINDLRQPIEYQAEPQYPTLAEAKAYADDFRTGAICAYAKGENCAKYLWPSFLDILTTRLQTDIYAVMTYTPVVFEYASLKEVESVEYFIGRILQYNPATESWILLAASQEVGIDEFKRLLRGYKAD